jgi:bacterioferritin-associated ferredoxin
MYVCICAAVSDRDIQNAVMAGDRSLEDVAARLGVGTVCGCCRELAADVVAECVAEAGGGCGRHGEPAGVQEVHRQRHVTHPQSTIALSA